MRTYCVPGSLHTISPFLTPSSFPVSPLSSPCLSGLSVLCQGKEHTFIEYLWYTKQLLVLSLFSSRPLISTDPWFLLSSASFCSLPGEELGIYRAPIVCLVISFHSPSLPLDSPCSFISDLFSAVSPFLGEENKQLWSTYCMPGNLHPTSSSLASFSLPRSFCQLLPSCVFWAFLGEGNKH